MSNKIRRQYFILYELRAPNLRRYQLFKEKYDVKMSIEEFLMEDDKYTQKELEIPKEHQPLVRSVFKNNEKSVP